jgi:hypothetical protein
LKKAESMPYGPCRPARLDPEQLAQLRHALLQSPTEHGFGTEFWTFKRAGTLINGSHPHSFQLEP